MTLKPTAAFVALTAVALLYGNAVLAGIDSGNDLARRYFYSQKGQEKELEKGIGDNVYFFRYMKILEKDAVTNSVPPGYAFKVLEPSSGMIVEFVVTKRESLKVAETVQKDDTLAFVGKIKTISKADEKIVLQQVILRYKDRAAPKSGKELLSDVDPNARLGSDTSSGVEKVIKKK